MKRLLGIALFLSAGLCAGAAVTGCATKTGIPQAAPTAPTAPSSSNATSPAAASPRQRAEADAAAVRGSFVPPPRARRLTVAPGVAGGVLRQPAQRPESPDLVDDASWWLVPGQPQAVLAWERAHLPRRFTSSGTGQSGGNGAPTAWSDTFSLPDVPSVLTSRELIVEVVGAGQGQTAIRVDSQVLWLPAKPAAERLPADATSVTISALPGGAAGGKPPANVTITNQAIVRQIASLADSLPVFPPATYSCPFDTGQGLELTFRGADGSTLAVVSAKQWGCSTVSVTVAGKQLLTLSNGASFIRQVLAVAHLHWPAVTARP